MERVGLEFADRTAVRSVLAWLRLAAPGRRGLHPDDLVEALKRPSRSFHPRVTSWISEQASVVDLFALAGRLRNEKDADRLTEFAADLQRLQQVVGDGAVTSDVLFMLIDEIGLGGSVSGLDATRRGMNRSSQGDDLTAVQQLAALHDDVASFEDWLRSALAVERSFDGVVLATVHRVKGQEWAHVVVHHADADQYPHRLADDHEEERRLFHVALTRASRHATIVPGLSPSPFVAELTEEPPPDRVGEPPRPGDAAADRASGTPTRRARRPSSSTGSSSDPTADLDDDGKALYAELRTLRSRLADGKPAYTVFDNKTMAFIAQLTPTSRSALGKIPGIGPAKLDKFGEEILDLVRGFVGDGA